MTNFRLYVAALSAAVLLGGAPATSFAASRTAANIGKPDKPDKGDKANKPAKVTWSPSGFYFRVIEEGEVEGDPGLISASFTTDK